MPKIQFTKMHGGGNDFVVINAVTQKIAMPRLLKVAQRLANRRLGIGCDQILILRVPKRQAADFEYQIINADGGEVGQCGNGARCAHAFLRRQKLTDKNQLFLCTRSTMITTKSIRGNKVRAYLAVPQFAASEVPMTIADGKDDAQPQWYGTEKIDAEILGRMLSDKERQHLPEKFAAVSLGNPHAVFPWPKNSPSLNGDESGKFLHQLGEALNQRRRTFPQGVNVGFYQRRGSCLDVRVYERGAGETPSCGSGAAAAALVWQHFDKSYTPVRVCMRGGELTCHWAREKNPPAVWIEGDIHFVFDGEIAL